MDAPRAGLQEESRAKRCHRRALERSGDLRVGKRGEMVQTPAQAERDGAAQAGGLEPHVRVREQQVLSRGGERALVKCVALAKPAFGQRANRHHTQPQVRAREALQHLPGAIGRAVVHGHDLQVRQVLREERAHGGLHRPCLIASREHHADARCLALRRRALILQSRRLPS